LTGRIASLKNHTTFKDLLPDYVSNN
jgi:hypothetical protein